MALAGNATNGIIVELHILIEPAHWFSALKKIESSLLKCNRNKHDIKALYFTYDYEDVEIRICFLVLSVEALERFAVSTIHRITGIYATRARLTLAGKIFPRGYQVLLSPKSRAYSAHVFLKIAPSFGEKAWAALSNLKHHSGTYPTWIFRDFYEYDRDVTLRVVGKDLKGIRSYLDKKVKAVPGVQTWRFKIMKDFVKIMDAQSLKHLALKFVRK